MDGSVVWAENPAHRLPPAPEDPVTDESTCSFLWTGDHPAHGALQGVDSLVPSAGPVSWAVVAREGNWTRRHLRTPTCGAGYERPHLRGGLSNDRPCLTFGGDGVCCYPRRMRCRSRVKPARPCIWRAIRLVLVLTPSVGPLLYGSMSPAITASMSCSRPRVKACRWGRSAVRTWAIQCVSASALSVCGVRSGAKSLIPEASWVISGQAAVSLARSSCCSGLRLSGLVSSIRASRRGEIWLRSASARPWLMYLCRRFRQPVKPRVLISSKRCLTGTPGSSLRRLRRCVR